jgi:predicted AAA+ superfamily ATPase
MTDLVEWKKNGAKKCLLVKGARQIGKTFIIREFAKQNYECIIELNFLTEPKHKKFFNGSLDMNSIIENITSQIQNTVFKKGKTLLYLDEIQECGQARTALKFIAEANKCDCIASGSMLGVAYKQITSIPVGYEEQLEMFSMDFEEFIWANGYGENATSVIKAYYDKKEKVPNEIHEHWLRLLRTYMIVGGMPSVVTEYVNTHNFGEVHKEQERILASYLDDIGKYAPASEKPKVRACYQSIPTQLAKENKKFQFAVVEKGANSRKFETSLEWLKDAGLIKFCYNVTTPVFPLIAYNQTGYFKVYGSDIGILTAMYGFEMKGAILDNTIKGAVKGGIYESLIADILLKKRKPLNYYKPSENRHEIEFLLTDKTEVIPLEVKSNNGSTTSLNEFIKEFKTPYALKFIAGNIGEAETKLTLPLYLAMFL